MQHGRRIRGLRPALPHTDQLRDEITVMRAVRLTMPQINGKFFHQALFFAKMLGRITGEFAKNKLQRGFIATAFEQKITDLVDQINQVAVLTINRFQTGDKMLIPNKGIHASPHDPGRELDMERHPLIRLALTTQRATQVDRDNVVADIHPQPRAALPAPGGEERFK